MSDLIKQALINHRLLEPIRDTRTRVPSEQPDESLFL